MALFRLCVEDKIIMGRIENRFKEEGRKDDNPESFKIRLGNYNEQTAPLLPFYAKQGKLTEVDGLADIETVAASIANVLDMQKTGRDVKPTSFWKRIFSLGS